jgi:hypothetical protein
MVILRLVRSTFSDSVTIGELFWDGAPMCYTLEDRDRGLHSKMLPQAIEQVKVKDETAIPYGFYEVTIDMSQRFQKLMPHVLDVPGFEGIRLHSGNSEVDTSGCILLGKAIAGDQLTMSRLAVQEFALRLEIILKTDRVFICVSR